MRPVSLLVVGAPPKRLYDFCAFLFKQRERLERELKLALRIVGIVPARGPEYVFSTQYTGKSEHLR